MITADANRLAVPRPCLHRLDAATAGRVVAVVAACHARAITALRLFRRAHDDPQVRGAPSARVRSSERTARSFSPWNDYAANTIAFNRSFDGGVTVGCATRRGIEKRLALRHAPFPQKFTAAR